MRRIAADDLFGVSAVFCAKYAAVVSRPGGTAKMLCKALARIPFRLFSRQLKGHKGSQTRRKIR